MTFDHQAMFMKEKIKHALNNEVIDYYDDNNKPVWIKAEKKETNRVILDCFDEAVYQAKAAMTSGRVLDRLYRKDMRKEPDFQEYLKLAAEEEQKYNTYRYEDESLNDCDIVKFPRND